MGKIRLRSGQEFADIKLEEDGNYTFKIKYRNRLYGPYRSTRLVDEDLLKLKTAFIERDLKSSFGELVGKKLETADAIKDQVSLATQRCLHNLNAQIHGGEVIACGTMWERFTWKQKAKWFIVNKLVPEIGAKARAQFEVARKAWYDEMPREDFEDGNYFPLSIDPLFELNPKGIIQTEVSMRLREPVEFIGIKLAIENEEVKDGDN